MAVKMEREREASTIGTLHINWYILRKDDWVTRRLGDKTFGWHGRDDWATALGYNKNHVLHILLPECKTSGSVAIIWHSHTKLIYLAKRGHFALKGVGINGGEPPKMGSIVRVLTAISRTCDGMTTFKSVSANGTARKFSLVSWQCRQLALSACLSATWRFQELGVATSSSACTSTIALQLLIATSRQWPPKLSVLGQFDCFSPCEFIGVHVILTRFHPCNMSGYPCIIQRTYRVGQNKVSPYWIINKSY